MTESIEIELVKLLSDQIDASRNGAEQLVITNERMAALLNEMRILNSQLSNGVWGKLNSKLDKVCTQNTATIVALVGMLMLMAWKFIPWGPK
jgi:hypothetical protein